MHCHAMTRHRLWSRPSTSADVQMTRVAVLKHTRYQKNQKNQKKGHAKRVPPRIEAPLIVTDENREELEQAFGRLSDTERDVVGALTTMSHEYDMAGIKTCIKSEPDNNDVSNPADVELPNMGQTMYMLRSWHTAMSIEDARACSPVFRPDDVSMPGTPGLSRSAASTPRSSVSCESPVTRASELPPSPSIMYPTVALAPPSVPEVWRHSISTCGSVSFSGSSSSGSGSSGSSSSGSGSFSGSSSSSSGSGSSGSGSFSGPSSSGSSSSGSSDSGSPTLGPQRAVSPVLSPPSPPRSGRYQVGPQEPNPFAKYRECYFVPKREDVSIAVDHGMPSPPRSPTDRAWMHTDSDADAYYHRQKAQARAKATVLPSVSSMLPTPPQVFTAFMPCAAPHAAPHMPYAREPVAPAAFPYHRQHSHSLSHSHGHRHAGANQGSPAARHQRCHDRSSPSPSPKAKGKKAPHLNVKYLTHEIDFIMYERITNNSIWAEVTETFNRALPRLEQYIGRGDMRSGGVLDRRGSADRTRARPKRSTSGLQASYYRMRLALPQLQDNGELIFDDATNKQVFTEVMVRDDKASRKSRQASAAGAAGTAGTAIASSLDAPMTVSTVNLILYFPERVSHYDYYFVSDADKAEARRLTDLRNAQRLARGLPTWTPECDDPDNGIIYRHKM